MTLVPLTVLGRRPPHRSKGQTNTHRGIHLTPPTTTRSALPLSDRHVCTAQNTPTQNIRSRGLLAISRRTDNNLPTCGLLALLGCLLRGAFTTEVLAVDSNPRESLLIDQVGICWLQAYAADLALAQRMDISIRQAKFMEKRRDLAHRRLTTAIKGLATIRKLLPAAGPADCLASEKA